MLTEETRRGFIKQAKAEAESAQVSIRNARRDANGMLKELLKEKDISEDDERRAQDSIQKLTDSYVAKVEDALTAKEADLMEFDGDGPAFESAAMNKPFELALSTCVRFRATSPLSWTAMVAGPISAGCHPGWASGRC